MAKVGKICCKLGSRYPLRSHTYKNKKRKKKKNGLKKQDWENAICSVCLEAPHNAVLLLCLSYKKGCRPFMCATSRRYSNCFEQYMKASTRNSNSRSVAEPNDNNKVPKLLCPHCRKKVKGWMVVEAARKFLNRKKKSCMKDDCCFVGTYKSLRKHVRSEHPFARSWEVDPVRVLEWRNLEHEILLNDAASMILTTVPGARIEGGQLLVPDGNGSFFAMALPFGFVAP